MRKIFSVLFMTFQLLLPNWAAADVEDDLNHLLDGFHHAAARADFTDYFSRFSKQSVFLGTDAKERWTLDEFKTYTKPHFAQGRGWSYTSIERFWRIEGKIAWFDEQLDNNKLGRCRGTGIAVLEDNQWKVAHYSLSLLIPNEIAADVAEQARKVTHE